MGRIKSNGSLINTTARLNGEKLTLGISLSGSNKTWDWIAYVQRRSAPMSWRGYYTFTTRSGYVNSRSGSVRTLYGVKQRGIMRVRFELHERGTGRKVVLNDRIR